MGREEGKVYVNRVDISFLGNAMTVGQETIREEGEKHEFWEGEEFIP